MSKGKTTSSINKAKVIQEKIANPDNSLRDLEKKTWVNYRTVWRTIKQDLSQVVTQSEHIANLIDTNQEILNITWDEIMNRLVDEDWKIRFDDLIKAKDLAFKQNHLIDQAWRWEWNNKTPIIISF